MLAELIIELMPSEKDFSFYKGSCLQGVLMELINPDYADFLHRAPVLPYSQYAEKRSRRNLWVIHTLNEEARREIISPLMDPSLNEICLRRTLSCRIVNRSLRIVEESSLMEEFRSVPPGRGLRFSFITPATFKRDRYFETVPSPRLLFQGLMKRYSAMSELEMADDSILEHLSAHCRVSSYALRSMSFPLESQWIPGFMGALSLRISGNETLARYARLLARFGEFSGVGAKTAMGMGAIRVRDLPSREKTETSREE